MSLGLLVGAWLAGALGGVHCMAMCGGLLGAISARDAAAVAPLRPARAIARRQAAYHGGRVATYALLGALFGAAGVSTLAVTGMLPLQRTLYAASSALLLVLGANLVIATPLVSFQRLGARAFAPLLRGVQPLLRQPGAFGRIALGMAWGLMPCALVYGVLPLALFAGGAWQGAAVMLAFGLGTVPNLIGAGMLAAGARRFLGSVVARRAGALLLVAFGVAGLWRVVFVPESLAQGVFCLLP